MIPEHEQHSRRTFLRTATSSIGLALSASTIASLLSSCEYTETAPMLPIDPDAVPYNAGANENLDAPGTIDIVIVEGVNDNQPVFISRVGEASYVVFSSTCTHAGCLVELPETLGANCVCPCHGSEYSPANGHVVHQPSIGSATDLPMFASVYDATTHTLYITP